MNLNEFINALQVLKNNYYNNMFEKDYYEDLLYILQKRNEKFIKISPSKGREDNYFDLIGVQYIQLLSYIYIYKGNKELNILDGDLIINANEILSIDLHERSCNRQNKSLTILRSNPIEVLNVPIELFQYTDCKNVKYANYIKSYQDNIYMNIKCFDKNIIAVLNKMKISNKNILMDLRDNMGGSVSIANEILELFLGGNTIGYYMENYKSDIKCVRFKKEPAYKDNNICIIINKFTASSAELVSAVLKENLGAKLVGQNTYGKGVMQKRFKINEKYDMVIPIYKFYTEHIQIHNRGLIPDVFMTKEEIVKLIENYEGQNNV